jgi:hypothetical protein
MSNYKYMPNYIAPQKDCWSSELTNTTFFGDVMYKDHFLQIFWLINVGYDTNKKSSCVEGLVGGLC